MQGKRKFFTGTLGYMLDVTRGRVPKNGEIFQLIDRLSALGYTHLELYIEHAFMFPGKEAVWKDASPLTPDDIRQIDRYAAGKGIELVPNLNTFGHLEKFLDTEEFRHLAECEEPYYQEDVGIYRRGVITPDEKSLEFVDSLLAGYTHCFTSDKINIGGDETYELGCGKSKERCLHIGKGELYLDFLLKLYESAKKYCSKVYFWGDIILKYPELVARLPKDVTVLNWGYEADHPFADETDAFAAAGMDFIVCPGTGSWNSLSGRTTNMLANLKSAVFHAERNNASGIMLTDWGDGGHFQSPLLSYPAISTLALLCEYGPDNVSDGMIAARTGEVFFGDKNSPWGELLLELGRMGDVFACKRNNTTLFNTIAFYESYPWANEVLKNISLAEIDAAWAKLAVFEQKLDTVADDSQIFREIANSVKMIRISLIRMRELKSLPLQITKKEAVALINEVIAEHCALWLLRCRPGGIEVALNRLEIIRLSFMRYAE